MLPGTKYGKDGTTMNLEPQPRLIRCPSCKSRNVIRKGKASRRIRASQVGHNKKVFFKIDVPVVECRDCGAKRQIELEIADERKSYTKAFASDAVEMLRSMTVLAVAKYLGVSWGLVNSILREHLEKHYPKRNYKKLRTIAIDETSIGKGHKYVTIVYDLEAGEPVHVAEGKSEASLGGFWEMVGEKALKKIKCVAMDMGGAYQAAAGKHIPGALVVFDRFHVVKLANKYLDDLRRREQRRPEYKGCRIIKGNRYLLLKNPENLSAERNEPERLKAMLELNKPLSMMYILKEDLRQFWEKGSMREADAAIDCWAETAASSGDRIIMQLGKSIMKFKEGILNWYLHRVSSGPLESMNNKIKVLSRRAFGYRNIQFFKLLVLAINEFNPKKTEPIVRS